MCKSFRTLGTRVWFLLSMEVNVTIEGLQVIESKATKAAYKVIVIFMSLFMIPKSRLGFILTKACAACVSHALMFGTHMVLQCSLVIEGFLAVLTTKHGTKMLSFVPVQAICLSIA